MTKTWKLVIWYFICVYVGICVQSTTVSPTLWIWIATGVVISVFIVSPSIDRSSYINGIF